MRRSPKRILQRAAWFGVLLITAGPLARIAGAAESSKAIPASTFAQQIADAQQLLEKCAATASACDNSGLPDKERVEGSPSGSFQITWQWLRDEIADSKKANPADRAKKMSAAQAHLSALAAQAGVAGTLPAGKFATARKAANKVLARPEFRTSVEGPTWTERLLARIQDWILRLLTGMDKVGRRAPWLAPLIEWSCFTLAIAGLLWFVRQTLARQTLRIALSESALLAANSDRSSEDWARLAEQRASAKEWRDAVHCLYWAAIALLESRRAWRPNATRTPREYVRLLRPGSDSHRLLRELTRSFERVWYGHEAAGEAQYRSFLEGFHHLEATRPDRTPAPDATAGPALPVAEGA